MPPFHVLSPQVGLNHCLTRWVGCNQGLTSRRVDKIGLVEPGFHTKERSLPNKILERLAASLDLRHQAEQSRRLNLPWFRRKALASDWETLSDDLLREIVNP